MARKARKRPVAEINVVPYIDVMLVLLIIFMVTAPFLIQGFPVNLPEQSADPFDNKDQEPIIVSLSKDGQYYVTLGSDEKQPQTLENIQAQIAKIMRQQPETPVLIWGDTDVYYGKMTDLMSALRSAGVPSVGLVTEPQ